jgi:hypothetical protein
MKLSMIKRLFLSSVAALTIAAYPTAAIVSADAAPTGQTPPADTTTLPANDPPKTETVTAPAPPVAQSNTPGPNGPTGQNQPNGADGSTYTYNNNTGLWENGTYAWDPSTHKTTPQAPQAYSYNPATGRWDTTEWRYDPAAEKYVANTYSVPTPPEGASGTTSNLAPDSVANIATAPAANHTFDNFYNAEISNRLSSLARSGDVLANSNTGVGNAASGNALAIQNLFNLLQSSANFLSGNQFKTFSANIQGDVVGDLLIDPGQINALRAINATLPDSLKVNNQATGLIDNQVNLGAASGNTTVSSNTKAGDATTGSADAVANVVNLLNSSVGAGQSFLGNINIYGNLNGDILLPPGFLDHLLASNGPTNPALTAPAAHTSLTNTVNEAITNRVNVDAATGTATAANNTRAGNVTSGNALTNMTILNLTGSDVIGANNLLVFVNVLGQWVGVIMNAPTGTTAASLGGGITQATLPTDATLATNSRINNDINVAARSGDATATDNTTVGNVRTGNATASVNLLNFVNSHLTLSDWFGVLFINVFGTWNGSFAVDTAAGNRPSSAPTDADQAGAAGTQPRMFQFVPTGAVRASSPVSQSGDTKNKVAGSTTTFPPAILASATTHTTDQPPQNTATQPSTHRSWVMPLTGVTLGFLLLSTERFIAWRRRGDT